MYKREEASQLRQAFWTTFGQYISPIPSSEGLRVNWLNYNTRLKHVFFRLNADQKKASISIDITHSDAALQELVFEQFVALKLVFQGYMGEEWEWVLHSTDENGRFISKIYKELAPVNVFNQDDWSKIISFLKPRLITLDEFWSDAKYSFDWLKN